MLACDNSSVRYVVYGHLSRICQPLILKLCQFLAGRSHRDQTKYTIDSLDGERYKNIYKTQIQYQTQSGTWASL